MDAVTTQANESAPTVTDDTVVFEIDGEAITVAQARNGFMRNKDYTQKNQAISAERREAQQAKEVIARLERDPVGTIGALQAHFGVSVNAPNGSEQAAAEVQDTGSTPGAVPPSPDVIALGQRVEQMEQEKVEAQLKAELEQIQAMDPNVDPQLLVNTAIERGLPNFDAAYKVLKFEMGQTPAPAEAGNGQEPVPPSEPNTEALEAKKVTAGMVANGSGAPEGATVTAQPDKFDTPAEAVAATIRQLEGAGKI